MFDGKESAEKLKGLNRKVITLPNSGVQVLIRKVIQFDFLDQTEIDIPTEPITREEAIEQGKNLLKRYPEKQRSFAELLLEKGTISPHVICDLRVKLKEEEIYINDLGDDLDFLLEEIIELSGLGDEGEAVSKFREEEKEDVVDV